MYITVQLRIQYSTILFFLQYIYQYTNNPKLNNNLSELGSYSSILHTFSIHIITSAKISKKNHTSQGSFPLSFITTLLI